MSYNFGFEFGPGEIYEHGLGKVSEWPEIPQSREYKTRSSSPLLGEFVQIVPPTPNISDLVDYLDATIVARGRVTVATQKVNFLAKLDSPKKPTWWKRLWDDPVKHFPTVRVTIELVQVGVSLTPLSNYRYNPIFEHAFDDYLGALQTKSRSCSSDVPFLGGLFDLPAKMRIEKELDIGGQLDRLLRQANVGLPVSAKDLQRHFWLVYATFPPEIKAYVVPRDRVILDEFEFDKSYLTRRHVAKIVAIARYVAALEKFVGKSPTIGIVGHTDARGTEKYNLDLGNRRAAAVNESLRKAVDSISPGLSSRMTIQLRSFGETKPLIQARTEAEHARNRRVEVLLPRPLNSCPRISIKAVVDRALKLLPRLGSGEQVQRISCLLRGVLQKGTDDRWVSAQGVLDVYNQALPPGRYEFALLRDELSRSGGSLTDVELLARLQRIDDSIIEGMSEINRQIAKLSMVASQGVATSGMKAIDALRAWMHAHVGDQKSIYGCYRNV